MQHIRACAAGDGAICSKNRKIVPCHGANLNTRNGARLRSPPLSMTPDIFESDDVASSCPVSYRKINQYRGTTATTGEIYRHYRTLSGACSELNLLQRSTGHYSESGYYWMRVDGEFFLIRKEKNADSNENYPDTCGRGLNNNCNNFCVLIT